MTDRTDEALALLTLPQRRLLEHCEGGDECLCEKSREAAACVRFLATAKLECQQLRAQITALRDAGEQVASEVFKGFGWRLPRWVAASTNTAAAAEAYDATVRAAERERCANRLEIDAVAWATGGMQPVGVADPSGDRLHHRAVAKALREAAAGIRQEQP